MSPTNQKKIMQQEPLVKLLSYILPSEFAEYFDLMEVKEEERNQELLLHLYLDEKDIQPIGLSDLQPNGFYAESFHSKVRLFRAQLYGVMDVKYFLFRLTNIYA